MDQKMNIRKALKTIAPPRVEKRMHVLEKHGDIREDPYYWLNERDSEEVISYLDAENEYLDTVFESLRSDQDSLFEEMVGRLNPNEKSVPYYKNGYYYRSIYQEGSEYQLYQRKKAGAEKWELLLNVNELAAETPFCHVLGLTISPDNRFLCYGIDTSGRQQYSLYIRDLLTDELLPEKMDNTAGYGIWAEDSKHLFYPSNNAQTLRTERILRHAIWTNPKIDKVAYHEKDDSYYVSIKKSRSGQYLLINSESRIASECQILSSNEPLGQFQCFLPRRDKHEYKVEHRLEHFYILSNDNAQSFELFSCRQSDIAPSSWKLIQKYQKGIQLQDFLLFDEFIVIQERSDGLTHFKILDERDGSSYYLPLKESVYVVDFEVNQEMNQRLFRYTYNSLTTPNCVYAYDLYSKQKTLLKQQEIFGGYDATKYTAQRIWAQTHDGIKIPVSIVFKNGYHQRKKKPLLLYGYGAYGISLDPIFSLSRLSLLDRGFAFAIAHIRGGQDMGRHWYETGKQQDKSNTFLDFISVGDYLVQHNWVSKNQLYAFGGSAGGLLIGNVMNARPDLWAGLIAAVPFVDVLTTMLDDTIPLTTGEYDEWGNPNEPFYYHLLKSYSPYDNVQDQPYPPLLITTGLHDAQVQYWEPAKWTAKLRDLPNHPAPVILHCNMEVGHGGPSGRFERFKETAMEYCFLLDLADCL
ncbi:MAG: S9 family peptidase [Saprospiraceae bacterium]